MNTCKYRNVIGSLVFMLAAIGSVAPSAAAEKAALVRDIDRPSVNPVAVACEADGTISQIFSVSCPLFTVPPNMVLVVDTISFFAATSSVTTIATPFLAAPNMPLVRFATPPNVGGDVTDLVNTQLQYPAGTELTFGFLTGSGRALNIGTSLFGHLVPAGSP